MVRRLILLGLLASCLAFGTFANAATITLEGDTSTTPLNLYTFEVADSGDGTGLVSLANLESTSDGSLEVFLMAGGGEISKFWLANFGFSNVSLAAGIYQLLLAPYLSPGYFKYELSGDIVAVPIPSMAWIFSGLIVGLGMVSRRRGHASARARGALAAA